MTTKDFPCGITQPSLPLRATAQALRALGLALSRVARRLLLPRRAPVLPPVLEFYAEAGAPEGALYVDGQLVGHLPGVTRL